jgi:hypothetical protein
MWPDVLIFTIAALLTNTVIPVQFDPVLLYFAARQSWAGAVGLSLLATACAGMAAGMDIPLAGFAARWLWRARSPWRWPWPRHFYVVVALAAFLPVPFTAVRASLVLVTPQPRRYVGAVILGRLPRYAGAVLVLKGLHLPDWTWVVLLAIVIASAGLFALAQLAWRPRRVGATGEPAGQSC